MCAWQPNQNINCKKCEHWEHDVETGDFGVILSESDYCYLLHHIRIYADSWDMCDKNGELKYLELLANLFDSLEEERDTGGCMFFNEDTQEFEFNKDLYDSINTFIANICPLYKEGL